jgi:hypothetical protein
MNERACSRPVSRRCLAAEPPQPSLTSTREGRPPAAEGGGATGLVSALDDEVIVVDATRNTDAVGSLEEDDAWYMHPDDIAEHEARLKFGAPDESGPTNIRRSGAWELARLRGAQHATAHRGRRRLVPRRATQRARRTRAVRARPSQSSTGDPPPGPRGCGTRGVEALAGAPRRSFRAPSAHAAACPLQQTRQLFGDKDREARHASSSRSRP